MNALEQFAHVWAAWAWSISWQFAVMVGLVACACWLLRDASPRLRHALWILALLKIVLPPTLAAPWGFRNWAMPPELPLVGSAFPGISETQVSGTGVQASPDAVPPVDRVSVSIIAIFAVVWAAVAILFWTCVLWRYRRLSRQITRLPSIDEGPVRVEFERLAAQIGVARVPDLHVTQAATSPYLIGVIAPKVVLPQTLLDEFDSEDLKPILLHELVHWQRRDTWIGCGQVVVQGLLWFHPLVWWASSQLRDERENVCDDAVVRCGTVPAQRYGEAILRVLTSARARSLVTGSLVGVFERGTKLQQRLENVMSYDSSKRNFGWLSWSFLGLFALAFLPMGRSQITQAQTTSTAAASATIAAPGQEAVATGANDDSHAADVAEKPPYPVVISTQPEAGATGVSPALSEITVTFDRDMGEGMSWTGGEPLFPPTDNARKAKWTDDRTCVLPVSLKRGEFYRLGINSKSYQNFKSKEGVPTPPIVIWFATDGANKAVERRVRVPEVVELDPANGAIDVDPQQSALRVTFNMPMGEAFSWTGGGESFPEVNGRPSWSKDSRTCTLPVTLKSGHEYTLGLNSLSHNNFQSKWGVPLKPVVYKFATGKE